MALINYTPEQIRQAGDGILSNGGNLQSLLTAAQQYGVPLSDLSGAYGMTGQQGEQYLNGQGFSAAPSGRFTNIASTNTTFGGGADSTNARSYLRGVVGGDLGSYNGSDTGINDQVLGSALADGRNLGDVMSMFPQFTQQQITDYYNSHQDGINAARDTFMQGQQAPAGDPAGGGAPGGGGPAGGGQPGAPGSQVNLQGYSQNPYLAQMAQGIQGQFNDNLNMNTLPALRGGAVVTGGVGGSRQGIAEGLAAGQSNKSAADAIANLYGQDYQQQMGRNLQQYGMDQSYSLGQGQLALGNRSLDTNAYLQNQGQNQNFYLGNRGMDLESLRTGGYLYGLGDQSDFTGINGANNTYQPYTGYGSSTSGTNGGGGVGTLAGAAAGYQMYNASRNPYDFTNNGNGNGGYSYGGTSYNNPSAYTA